MSLITSAPVMRFGGRLKPLFVGVTESAISSTGTPSVTLGVPSGAKPGDMLIFASFIDLSPGWDPNPKFSRTAQSSAYVIVDSRIMLAGDSTFTWTINTTASTAQVSRLFAYRRARTLTAVTNHQLYAGPVVTPSVTPSSAPSVLLAVFASSRTGPLGAVPGGMIQRGANLVSGTNATSITAEQDLTTLAATGTRSVSDNSGVNGFRDGTAILVFP